MSVKKEFSTCANHYQHYNIIQQIVAERLVKNIPFEPKRILELGSGSGQVYRQIHWPVTEYKAIDFSSSMCSLHPRSNSITVECMDFDSEEFCSLMRKEKSFDSIISSSALQWSKDLTKVMELASKLTQDLFLALFTSNTFKQIQIITGKPSPILSEKSIIESCSLYFDCKVSRARYELAFDSKHDLFRYIKKSGVSGGEQLLSYQDAKSLWRRYNLNYLEFEVLFITGKRKSF